MLNFPPKPNLADQIAAVPYWYHKIPLPDGTVTPGWAPLDAEMYGIPKDLTGKRVLDVGAWDGYWSFEALRRGAKQVVAIDDFSDYLGFLDQRQRPAWETFDLCRGAWGYSEQVCERREMSVYDVSEEILGRFDVIFFFGTLYHLRHPLLAIDKLAAICNQQIYVESAILDDFSPYQGGLGHGYGNQMVMEFYPTNEYGNNHTNYWTPTLQCLGYMLTSAGFNSVKAWKLEKSPQDLPRCRGFAVGSK